MIDKIKSKLFTQNENNKIVIKNMTGAFIVKGMALVISLFTMPAYIKYFDNQAALGLWFTINSVLSWILNFDLGIGHGLRNHLSHALSQKNYKDAKKYVSSAYLATSVLAITCSVIFAFAFRYINWNRVFNITTDVISSKAMLASVIIVFVGIIMQFVFKLINSVLYAMQKSTVNNFLVLAVSVLGLVYVLVAPSGTNDRNLIMMAVAHVFAVILPLLITSIIVFSGKLKEIRPSFRYFDMKYAKQVLGLGGAFFIIQSEYIVMLSTNEYLITAFTKTDYVVEFQIYLRLFIFGSTLFTLALTPIWSVVTKALAENNIVWVKKLYKRLMLAAAFGCFIEIAVIPPLVPFAMKIWLGENAIQVNYLYGVVFAILGSLMIFNTAFSSVAGGAGKVKAQLYSFTIGAIIKVPLAWLMVKLTGSWIGVVMATIISLGISCIVQPIYLKKYFDNNINNINDIKKEQ